MLARALLRHVLFPAAERLTQTQFWSYYTNALRFDFMDADQRYALQSLSLSRVWNAALSSPLHRQRLEATGLPSCHVDSDGAHSLLGKLPPIDKSELRRWFPEGTLTTRDRKDWRYVSTSGTTDDKLTVVADFVKRDHNRSSELRALQIAMNADVGVKTIEIPPNACNVVCGVAEPGPGTFWGYLWYVLKSGTAFSAKALSDLRGRFERQIVLSRSTLPPIEPAPPVELGEVLIGHLNHIGAVAPKLLRAFPLYLLWLADCLQARRRTLSSLRVVVPYGGLASTQMIRRITTGLGAPFVNIYGTNELGTVAASCGRSPGMHVFEDIFQVELFQQDRPARHDEVGRLVITDLTNTAMPLIRYEVGDVGRLHLGPCPCGRKTMRLEVLGRLEETLETPSGPLPASHVADTFFADAAIANFRLDEIAPACFEAAIVPTHLSAKPDVDSWKGRFAALHPDARRLRARVVPFVRPERSGKYRFVHPVLKDLTAL